MQETTQEIQANRPFNGPSEPMPSVFWMVTEQDFGGHGQTAVAGIFDTPAGARHFIHELQHCGMERGHLAMHQLPWSGADGGYVRGSEEPTYRPLRCVGNSPRPDCDFDDG